MSTGPATAEPVIARAEPDSVGATAMLAALWEEIQTRYGFRADNPLTAQLFSGPDAAFWLATATTTAATATAEPVGSIAVTPMTGNEGALDVPAYELDAMYVAPRFRGTGVAGRLLAAAQEYVIGRGAGVIRLRTGEPQPESVRFYQKSGFTRIPRYGHWRTDESAWCFEKTL